MKTKILATRWNEMLDRLKRNRITGVTILDDGGWRHPWNVRSLWNNDGERWEVDIEPGFVEGLPATIEVDGVEVPLIDRPRLPLTSFRALGSDGASTGSTTGADGSVRVSFDAVPAFFRALGVGDPPDVVLDGTTLPNLEAPSSARLLRACDLVLHQDRLATSTQWTFGTGADGIIAEFTVSATSRPDARRSAFVRAYARWQLPAQATRQQLVAGNWTDLPQDQELIATVYLVSPPGAPAGSAPDRTWTPYVKQGVGMFWNLNYATNHLRRPLAKQVITLNTGLAAGQGDLVNNWILSQQNDAASAASEFIRRERLEGLFWSV